MAGGCWTHVILVGFSFLLYWYFLGRFSPAFFVLIFFFIGKKKDVVAVERAILRR